MKVVNRRQSSYTNYRTLHQMCEFVEVGVMGTPIPMALFYLSFYEVGVEWE